MVKTEGGNVNISNFMNFNNKLLVLLYSCHCMIYYGRGGARSSNYEFNLAQVYTITFYLNTQILNLQFDHHHLKLSF